MSHTSKTKATKHGTPCDEPETARVEGLHYEAYIDQASFEAHTSLSENEMDTIILKIMDLGLLLSKAHSSNDWNCWFQALHSVLYKARQVGGKASDPAVIGGYIGAQAIHDTFSLSTPRELVESVADYSAMVFSQYVGKKTITSLQSESTYIGAKSESPPIGECILFVLPNCKRRRA